MFIFSPVSKNVFLLRIIRQVKFFAYAIGKSCQRKFLQFIFEHAFSLAMFWPVYFS